MKPIYIGFLILATLIGLFLGYYIWGPTWQSPHELEYDILKDVLAITLAVLAVIMVIVGYSLYQILSGRLQLESTSASRIETTRSSARLLTHTGFTFWKIHDESETKIPQYLDFAISLTDLGLQYFNELHEREQKQRHNEELLCTIKNNLAYYLAERNRVEDKDLAKEYAKFIRQKSSQYPTRRAWWIETCDFVEKQYPS